MILVTASLINIISYDPFYKSSRGIDAIKGIPKNFGEWKGYDLLLEGFVYNVLETRAIIHRQYFSEKSSVFLSLVYYPETKVDFHIPESCLAGRGHRIKKSSKTISLLNNGKVVKVKVNVLIHEYQGSKQLIYYFYKAGSFFGKSYIQLRVKLAKKKLIGRPKSGTLIRVSTPLINEAYSDRILVEFIRGLYPYIMENL